MRNDQDRAEAAEQAQIEAQHAAFLRSAQEYLSIKEAARIMGVSSRCVYDSIRQGRLLSVRVGSSLSVSAAAARAYQRPSVGRPRSRIPIWRVPVACNLQYLWISTVRLRQGQGEQLAQRLTEIRTSGKHLLAGTVARFVVQNTTDPEQLQIVLIWRQLAMPPEEEREAAIAAFQADLADMVEWETARSTEGLVLMNT